jgi:hypothetical protein
MTSPWPSREQVPPLVAAAQAVARQQGFPLTREKAGPERPGNCWPGTRASRCSGATR